MPMECVNSQMCIKDYGSLQRSKWITNTTTNDVHKYDISCLK